MHRKVYRLKELTNTIKKSVDRFKGLTNTIKKKVSKLVKQIKPRV